MREKEREREREREGERKSGRERESERGIKSVTVPQILGEKGRVINGERETYSGR